MRLDPFGGLAGIKALDPVLAFDDELRGIDGARPDGAGTRHGNPSFANAAAGDYRLRADSDAIDHGDDTAVDSADGRDLDGQPRRVRTVDMGAYEFQGQAMPPSVVNSVPATGPWALGWVAAMLALAAGWHLRRRG